MNKENDKMSELITLRCTVKEKNEIKRLAEVYADGNMSKYIINQAIYSDSVNANDSKIEWSNRRVNEDPPN